MKYDMIMVRFGELSTKGKNKKEFINILARNIKNALREFSKLEYEVLYDHIYVKLNGLVPDIVIPVLQDVSGIQALSLVLRTSDEINNLENVALELINNEVGKTFKIITRRGNKKYHLNSDAVNRHLATKILKNTSLKVDVHNPDISINVDIRDEGAYLFVKTFKGAGGYPVGCGAKVMHMLSGGIDSPVAAYLLLKRGLRIECIHFASPPYTNIGVINKLKDLLRKLNKYQESIRLSIIPFTKLQEEIYRVSDESYAITIMRRMMYRLASRLAIKNHSLGISNGESVGQVASQTLESIAVINDVTNMPILRPLIASDKTDIIALAKKIDTYDISIRPFEDCCTIFDPKNPKTKPSLKKVEYFEAKFDYETLIQEALDNVEVIYLSSNDEELI